MSLMIPKFEPHNKPDQLAKEFTSFVDEITADGSTQTDLELVTPRFKSLVYGGTVEGEIDINAIFARSLEEAEKEQKIPEHIDLEKEREANAIMEELLALTRAQIEHQYEMELRLRSFWDIEQPSMPLERVLPTEAEYNASLNDLLITANKLAEFVHSRGGFIYMPQFGFIEQFELQHLNISLVIGDSAGSAAVLDHYNASYVGLNRYLKQIIEENDELIGVTLEIQDVHIYFTNSGASPILCRGWSSES
jgi:hypothetical protein